MVPGNVSGMGASGRIGLLLLTCLLLSAALPPGAADREPGAETAGIQHGYRMLDHLEADGPEFEGYTGIEHPIASGTGLGSEILLPVPFPVYGCSEQALLLSDQGIVFPTCGSIWGFDAASTDVVYLLYLGADSRDVPATLLYLDYPGVYEGILTFAGDGALEAHVFWTDGSVTYTFSGGPFDESIDWDPVFSGWGAARWEPYGVLENVEEE